MTLSGCNTMQSWNCSCCETPFGGILPFSPYSACFKFQAFLACRNSVCLAVFAICLLWPFHTFSMFVLLDRTQNQFLISMESMHHAAICCSLKLHDRFWHLVTSWYFEPLFSMRAHKPQISTFAVRSSWFPKNEIGFGTLAGVPRGCTKPLACHSVSSAKRIPQRLSLWKGGRARHHTQFAVCKQLHSSELAIEILAIQTGWDENAEWSNSMFGFQAPCGPRIRLSQILVTECLHSLK